MLSTFILQPETGGQEMHHRILHYTTDMLIIWSKYFQNMKVNN